MSDTEVEELDSGVIMCSGADGDISDDEPEREDFEKALLHDEKAGIYSKTQQTNHNHWDTGEKEVAEDGDERIEPAGVTRDEEMPQDKQNDAAPNKPSKSRKRKVSTNV